MRVTVVENGSSVARSLAEQYGADYLVLPHGNASRARNAGAQRGDADIVAFLDDDTVPHPGWLARLVEPLLCGRAGAATGAVEVSLEGGATPAVRAEFVETSQVMDSDHPFLLGGNMAITKAAFDEVGGFEPELGPGALGGHEDVLLGLQLVALGRRIEFVPSAGVDHVVPAARLTRHALLARNAGSGRGQGWVIHHWLGTTPRHLRLRVLRSRLLLVAARIRTSPDRERAPYSQILAGQTDADRIAASQ